MELKHTGTLDVSDDGTSLVVHELDTDLGDTTTRACILPLAFENSMPHRRPSCAVSPSNRSVCHRAPIMLAICCAVEPPSQSFLALFSVHIFETVYSLLLSPIPIFRRDWRRQLQQRRWQQSGKVGEDPGEERARGSLIVPVRPSTRVTLTSLTGALLLDSIVIDACS
jgi:hypothetical protein